MNIKLNSTGYFGLLCVAGISFFYILITFGYHFIIGDSSFWATESDDVTQYIAGFNMYFTSPWHFPLLAFDSLNYPLGTRATFVDAIPLYSFLLKVFLPSSMAPFNPFGVWITLCFLFQGIAAWWIARELGIKSWWFIIGLLAVFLTYPALLLRIGHTSLMSHWILLFAVALYIRSYRLQKLPVTAWTVFLVCAFYINIYLFVMASGLYLTAFLSIRSALFSRSLLFFPVPYVVLVVSMFIMLLPFPPDGVATDTGFGFYSMNLLSPFIGGGIFDVQGHVMPGQYEGFNYLGLGVIIAFVTAFMLIKRRDKTIVRRHWALLALLVGYTVYALASNVYFGSELVMLVHYSELLDPITSQFRATGRFFWPVGYCIVIFSFFVLYRYLSRQTFALMVVALVCVQWIDIYHHYQSLRVGLIRQQTTKMDYPLWDKELGTGVKTLYFYPKFKCGQDPHNTLLPIMKYASIKGLNLNTGYISRYNPNCHDYDAEIAQSSRSDSAYVFVKNEYADLAALNKFFPIDTPPACKEVDFAYVCR